MKYPTVKFTQQDLIDAKAHDAKMLQRRGNTVSHTRIIKHPAMVAYLGELAFERYLLALEIAFAKPPEHTGNRGDTYDFLCGQDKLDVKTTLKYDEILIDANMAGKAIDENTWLVLIRITNDMAELRGYQHANCLQRAPDKDFPFKDYIRKMYRIPQSLLIPFKKIINL